MPKYLKIIVSILLIPTIIIPLIELGYYIGINVERNRSLLHVDSLVKADMENPNAILEVKF